MPVRIKFASFAAASIDEEDGEAPPRSQRPSTSSFDSGGGGGGGGSGGGGGGGGGSGGGLNTFGIAVLTFSCVAGGPFGIESAVQSMGAFATVAGLVSAALLWGMPNALITAELSTAIPSNGGPVVWVRRALGARWGFVNGLLLVFQQCTDVCLYPTLLAAYCGQLWPQLPPFALYLVKLASVLAALALNVVGVDALSASSTLFSVVIMLPFVLLPAVAAAQGTAFDFGAVAPGAAPPGWASNLALFCGTILWNMAGWSEVGCMAGEVGENAATAFPRGMAIACVMITLAYATPVLFGAALQPDTSQWTDGYFVTLAQGVAGWLGVLVLVAAALANQSTLVTSLGAYARTLQAVARARILPAPLLARNFTRFRTPVPALALISLSTAALTYNLDFSSLVVLDSAVYMIAQCSIIASFLRLKYTEPDLARPFTFPGGIRGAWLASVVTTALAAASVYAVAGGGALWASYATAGAVVGLGLLSLAAEACGAGADSKEAPRRPGGRRGRGASAGAGSDHAASLVDSAAEVELVDGEALYSGLLDEDDG